MAVTVGKIAFLVVVLVTNAIQAITGFAGTLLAMPPSIMLLGVDEAKVILNFIAWITCLVIVLQNRKVVQWRILGEILLFMAIGMVAGIQIFKMVRLDFLLYGYGVLIIIIAITKLLGGKERHLPSWLLIIVLLAAGIIHGMFVSGGALLVVYAAYALRDKNEFRATVAAVWVVLNTFLAITQIQAGSFSKDTIMWGLIACIPAFIGVLIGNRLHNKISQKLFMKVTYVLLMISGILCFL